MKALIITLILIFGGLSSYGQSNNDILHLKEKIFFNTSEIAVLKGFECGQGGTAVEIYYKRNTDKSARCDTILVLMVELIPIKEVGSNKRKIIDYLILTNKDFNKDFNGLCSGNVEKNGISDPEIFVIYKYEDKEYFDKIHKAWKADRKLKQIYEIKPRGLRVVHEGFYADNNLFKSLNKTAYNKGYMPYNGI